MAAAQGVDTGMPSFNNKTHSVLHSSLGAGGNAPKSGLPTARRHLVPILLRLTAKEEDLASKDLSWPSMRRILDFEKQPTATECWRAWHLLPPCPPPAECFPAADCRRIIPTCLPSSSSPCSASASAPRSRIAGPFVHLRAMEKQSGFSLR